MRLLVTTSRSVLLFDAATGRYHPIHTGAGLYYGITASRRHYLVAARKRMVSSSEPPESERGEILIFNRRLEHVGTWQAPFALRDMHEIKWHRGRLWVTCSLDNMVAIREPDGRWRQWYPLGEPEGGLRDRNHFNSLHLRRREVWVLAHNRGPSDLLQFDLDTLSLLHRLPLGCQAHNIWREAGAWCICSSGEGTVLSERGVLAAPGGFPRGVARVGASWAVGVSQLAERHRRDLCDGQIVLLDHARRESARHVLAGEGLVLDLLPLNS